MKTSELRQKTKADLGQMLEDKQHSLAVLNFDLASGKVKNIKEIRSGKREIARLKTLIREQELKQELKS
jgi:large subunit ribosomal protein L29